MLAGLPSSASLTPQFPLLPGLKPTPPISHRRLPGEATGRHPAGSRGKESGGSLRAPRVGRMRAGRAGQGRAKLGRAGQGRVRASRWAPSPDPQQGPAVTAITAGTPRPPPPAAAASPRGPDPAPAPTLPAGWEHPAGTAGPGSGPTSAPGSAQGAGEGRWAGGPLPHPSEPWASCAGRSRLPRRRSGCSAERLERNKRGTHRVLLAGRRGSGRLR